MQLSHANRELLPHLLGPLGFKSILTFVSMCSEFTLLLGSSDHTNRPSTTATMAASSAWPCFLLSKRQSALYRLQRVLGIKSNGQDQHTLHRKHSTTTAWASLTFTVRPQLDPVRPVPFVFEKDVILVAVDIRIQGRDDAPSYIEVGLSALDTRDLAGAVPGYDAANSTSNIKCATYIAHDTATSFRPSIGSGSKLAEWALGCLRKEVAHWLHRTCHRIDASEVVTPPEDFAANIVLVAHDT